MKNPKKTSLSVIEGYDHFNDQQQFRLTVFTGGHQFDVNFLHTHTPGQVANALRDLASAIEKMGAQQHFV